MTNGRLLCCFSLLLPLLLILLPVLLPPFLIRLAEITSRANAYLDHKLGADLTSQSWEYIVVGAGSAGSVVAGRLAAAGHQSCKMSILLQGAKFSNQILPQEKCIIRNNFGVFSKLSLLKM